MIEFKRDPYVFALYIVVITAATILLWQHIITWDEVKGLGAGLLMPSLFGIKRQPEDVKSVTAKSSGSSTPPEKEKKEEKKEEGEDTPTTAVATEEKKDK